MRLPRVSVVAPLPIYCKAGLFKLMYFVSIVTRQQPLKSSIGQAGQPPARSGRYLIEKVVGERRGDCAIDVFTFRL